jgi:hypothetical protein
MDERRSHPRYTIWFPVTVDAESTHELWAICKDASSRGILIASNAPLAVGARVKVTFRVTPEDVDQTVEGHVVRIGGGGTARWPHQLAIAFDRELPELEGQLKGQSAPPAS